MERNKEFHKYFYDVESRVGTYSESGQVYNIARLAFEEGLRRGRASMGSPFGATRTETRPTRAQENRGKDALHLERYGTKNIPKEGSDDL